MGASMVDIYGVATFYKSFTLHPRGKHLVSVCLGTACHVRGGAAVAAEFQRRLGIRSGETTTDREFSFEAVNCLGACAIGPIVVVDGRYFSKVNRAAVKGILAQARAGFGGGEFPADGRAFPLEVSCSHCNHSLMDPERFLDGHPSIRVTAVCGGQHGWVCLSSVYGSYNVEQEHAFPMAAIVDFFCPHCHAELRGVTACTDCGAPMVSLMVRGGGMVRICTRQGCRSHMLDLSGVNV
jgi:(2Fe-2S) ferredoxin